MDWTHDSLYLLGIELDLSPSRGLHSAWCPYKALDLSRALAWELTLEVKCILGARSLGGEGMDPRVHTPLGEV